VSLVRAWYAALPVACVVGLLQTGVPLYNQLSELQFKEKVKICPKLSTKKRYFSQGDVFSVRFQQSFLVAGLPGTVLLADLSALPHATQEILPQACCAGRAAGEGGVLISACSKETQYLEGCSLPPESEV